MKNKIKNLSWMLPILMCTSSVFAIREKTSPEKVTIFTVMASFYLLFWIFWRVIIFIYNKAQINFLSKEEVGMLKKNEDELEEIDEKRIMFIKKCINAWCIFGIVIAIAILYGQIASPYNQHAFEIMSVPQSGFLPKIEFYAFVYTFVRLAYTFFGIVPIVIIWTYHFIEKFRLYKILKEKTESNKEIKNLSARIRVGYTLSLCLANTALFWIFSIFIDLFEYYL